ncbi:DNA polymerase III subunit epsilon [Aliidiomarina iranensis]|uniref:DNA polymerase III subunit epsilon n=1 Tax=Aliidiomarina iranensis TaxID=1434071 RepID=A0A432W0X9_9GAMM|nr:DNA polymerase III subunit epsilon [Aliidiomarina iranensis]RUO22638.1 DNA polymerase III subunit epsilon [Aliidiomarina iranensis]
MQPTDLSKEQEQIDRTKRQIVLDTETTGIDPALGHRVIEIGCVEMIGRKLTGKHFHVYLNPERFVEEDAIRVHGITNEFLVDKPVFAQVVDDFLAFIKDSELVIHNAPFDVGFLNNELRLLGSQYGTVTDVASVFDTLSFARQQFPGQRNSLDALCKRFDVENGHRTLHGALLDAEILADVFLLMTGGQRKLFQPAQSQQTAAGREQEIRRLGSERSPLKIISASADERSAHENYLREIQQESGECLWQLDETAAN